MVDELLCNALRGKNSNKNHGNKFEFSHEERCTVVHLTLILIYSFLFTLPQTFTTN